MISQQADKSTGRLRPGWRVAGSPAAGDVPTPRPVDRAVARRSDAFAFSADATATADVDRSAAVLARDLLEPDEIIILLLRPSLWYVPLGSLASLGLIALLTFVLAYMSHLPWARWNDVQVFALGVGLCALRLGWQLLEWMSRAYVLTDRRVVSRSGVLRVCVFQAPLKSIQHTAVFAGMRERLFGLGTIGFATAGSDTFDTLWVMIKAPHHVHKAVIDAVRRYGT
jgi:membrane protein YdbS with pleckstrin-like domain